MRIAVDNAHDFWATVDAMDDIDFSVVIEAKEEQCCLYVYQVSKKKICAVLLIPKGIKIPFEIDVAWHEMTCKIVIDKFFTAKFNAANMHGEASPGIAWIDR